MGTILLLKKEIISQEKKWASFLSGSSLDEKGMKNFDIWGDEELWKHREDISNTPPQSNVSGSLIFKKMRTVVSKKMKRSLKLKNLIRGGIPPKLRGSVWWSCSGGEAKRRTVSADFFQSLDYAKENDISYFQYLVSKAPQQAGLQVSNDIEKDLPRTFPIIIANLNKQKNNSSRDTLVTASVSGDTASMSDSRSLTLASESKYSSVEESRLIPEEFSHTPETFLAALRRVLLAYALHNPRVGYCQSMNYICALLLFHIRDEDRVFWILAVIVEDICANYYIPSLIGVRADNLAFQAILAHYFPKLFAVFKAADALLEPIIMPWFLCLYVNALPLYAVCRVWDCLFWQGREVLFRIGLQLLNSKAQKIQQECDYSAIYSLLKSENMGHGSSFQLESAPRRLVKKRRNHSKNNKEQSGSQSNDKIRNSWWDRMKRISHRKLQDPPPSPRLSQRIDSGYGFGAVYGGSPIGNPTTNCSTSAAATTITSEKEEEHTTVSVATISDSDLLIASTFRRKLPFLRAMINDLRCTISERLVTADKAQRRQEQQQLQQQSTLSCYSYSRDSSDPSPAPRRLSTNSSYGGSNGYRGVSVDLNASKDAGEWSAVGVRASLRIPVTAAMEMNTTQETWKGQSLDDGDSKCSSTQEYMDLNGVSKELTTSSASGSGTESTLGSRSIAGGHSATYPINSARFSYRAITGSAPVTSANSTTVGSSMIRRSSHGVLTAFFSTPRTTYTQRSCMSHRSESCFSMSSVASSRASEKRMSLMRVVTEEELTIMDIHSLGQELREDFEMELEKLAKTIKNRKAKCSARDILVEENEEDPMEDEVHVS
mmetsp:Transcript_12339/g.18504  ORF Transcript_12339/g.18504 Transcript_12339/m.18504 type:complete len:828 (-) Transcript_12339:237-2720(-)